VIGYAAAMALDKEKLGNFVGVLIASLRSEIDETGRRAVRLGEALRHGRDIRAAAEDALETSRAQREAREERLKRANAASEESG
jgi:hypothetical protein